MTTFKLCPLLLLFIGCFAQRSPYAGKKPIGYPELVDRPTTSAGLENKFGEDSSTQKIPIEALGDRELVDRLSKLPPEQQPFWFLNWQALEAHRNIPQTFQPNPSQFMGGFWNAPDKIQMHNLGYPADYFGVTATHYTPIYDAESSDINSRFGMKNKKKYEKANTNTHNVKNNMASTSLNNAEIEKIDTRNQETEIDNDGANLKAEKMRNLNGMKPIYNQSHRKSGNNDLYRVKVK